MLEKLSPSTQGTTLAPAPAQQEEERAHAIPAPSGEAPEKFAPRHGLPLEVSLARFFQKQGISPILEVLASPLNPEE